ncbi:unnamed protein product [Caenorhabditis auriculariae]|uniref:SAP domain-containing protein n=1 Tax=Caenorhabditis auriculariae TaxID=2777116 RepID=A0A8S1HI19_9PELO|nr:unnamed protein product [Caenorhabditis auriculariae]
MSQFGAGKPGGWGRPPAGGGQVPGFPTMNVGGFPMMGVPMGMVNQAAFSQPNMMGMQGIMGAVPQQQLQQPPQQLPTQAVRAPPAQPANGLAVPQGAKNRTFVGTVTKMLDNYGFVDDDVFFQHSVIRGAHPRVNDKVMVEANYNPGMPFKWNAFRIQLLNATPAPQEMPAPAARQPPSRTVEQSRWGPGSGNDRSSNGRGVSPARMRRETPPPRRASPRRISPKRDPPSSRPSRRSPRRSPPPVRRSSPARPERSERKRERSPGSGSVAPSVRRDSASPPRRRARIIPRYECKAQKQVLLSDVVSGATLRSRYSKMYLPSDFVDMSFDWSSRIPLEMSIDFTNPIQFHVFHKDVDFPLGPGEEEAILEPDDADHRHQVKVLLLSHAGKSEILKKAYCLMPDGSSDDHQEPQSVFKNISFLVGSRGKELMGIGGSWSPSLDGADPTSPATLIRTAVRTTKALTGIDLSIVPQWYSMVQVRYYRSDKDRVDRVHLLWPDTQLLTPSDDSWDALQASLSEQLQTKIVALDALNVVEPPVDSTAAEKTGDDEKPEASHWSKLDTKAMKVAELRLELEARSLETKGIKTLLVQRLQAALDAEKQNDGSNDSLNDVVMKEESETEKPEEITEQVQKTEAELKKEAEELQKKNEKIEKEKKEKKDSLERHFAMPKDKKIFVYPSKTAKQGKFDCKVISLNSMLEYRSEDNKESQFEVSLFAEAFREMVERLSAFGIYTALSVSADKEEEKKRRDDARGKAPVEKKEEDKEDKKEETKPEKIDLKSIVSNRNVFESFAYFDQNLCGYIMEKDIEEILFNGEFGLSRGQIQRLSKKLSSRDKINYRHLTDVLVDSDGIVKFTPGQADETPDVAVLTRGYGLSYAKMLDGNTPNGEISSSDDGNVIINGNVINVPLKLKMLKTMEQERDSAKASLNENISLIDQLREAKSDIDKKKKDLEKDLEKSKKKVGDLTSSLKSTSEENSSLKTVLTDIRKYADRIIVGIEKHIASPKKEVASKEKEEKKLEKTEKEEKTQTVAPTTDETPATAEMVLTEEVGPEE